MTKQSLPVGNGQALPSPLETGTLRRCITSWLLDGKLRQLSSGTLSNRKLICEKLMWFLDQNELPICGVSELKKFLSYVGSGHEEEGGRWGNEAKRSTAGTPDRRPARSDKQRERQSTVSPSLCILSAPYCL